MLKKILLTTAMAITFPLQVWAAGNYVTTYSFNDIAGDISGNTITVTVPYKTPVSYWNHKVLVTDGAYFTTSNLDKIDDKHYKGCLTVIGADGTSNDYTVNINKRDYVEPSYSMGSAKSIKKNSAKIPVNLTTNDGNITSAQIVYYTKKNNTYNRSISGSSDVELTGLQEDTKYYYYLSVRTPEKTYETSAKSFKTKKSSDTGTSSSSSTKQSSKGTNTSGTSTTSKQDNTLRNQWSLSNGKWYYYDAAGFSKTDWFQVGDTWYYVTKGSNELAMNCWKEIGGTWYYFDAAGAMLSNQWVYSNNAWYWIGPSGSMLTNDVIAVGGKIFLLGPDGVCMDNKMVMCNGAWMYYKPDAQGLSINETFQYNGSVYRSNAEGFLY